MGLPALSPVQGQDAIVITKECNDTDRLLRILNDTQQPEHMRVLAANKILKLGKRAPLNAIQAAHEFGKKINHEIGAIPRLKPGRFSVQEIRKYIDEISEEQFQAIE